MNVATHMKSLTFGVLPTIELIDEMCLFLQAKDIGTGAFVLRKYLWLVDALGVEKKRLEAIPQRRGDDDFGAERAGISYGIDFIDLFLGCFISRFNPLVTSDNNYMVAALLHPTEHLLAIKELDPAIVVKAKGRVAETAKLMARTNEIPHIELACQVLV